MSDVGAADRLIGRDGIVGTAVRTVADGARVVTFAGRHGVGKSRVAAAVAAQLPGPRVVVRVDDATDEAEHLARCLDALGLEGTSLAAVAAHLRATGGVLLLDDCVVTEAAARVVAALVERVPSVVLLVTSPTPLAVAGEVVVPVPPLELPPPDEDDPQAIAQAPAVALFLAAAARASPAVVLDDVDMPAVAEVCRRLDGLPLALRTAAARLALLQPAAMLAEMARVGPLELVGLSGEDELRRAVALLDPSARQVARAFTVMAGGAGLGALAAVAALPEADVMTAVALLVELQLASADPVRARYALSVGAAAAVRAGWDDDEERRRLVDRHAAYFQQQARAFARRPHGTPMDPAWLLDHRNRLDALAALRDKGDRAGALRLVVDCMPAFEHRGELDAGRRLLAEVLRETPESTSGACISAHLWLGRLEAERADGVRTAAAREHFASALRLARERGHLVLHLEVLNAIAENQVVLEDGVALSEEAVAEGLALTDGPGLELPRAVFLAWRSASLHRRNRLDEALDALGEALHAARAHGDRRLVMSFAILYWQLPAPLRERFSGVPSPPELLDMADEQGDVRAKGWVWMVVVGNALDVGDDRGAAAGTLEMLRLSRRTGQRPLARQSLVATVRLLGRYPRPLLAAQLAGVLAPHSEGVRAHLPPRWVADLESALGHARAVLGDDGFDAAHREGGALGLERALDRAEEALELLLADDVRPAGFAGRAARTTPVQQAGASALTPREADVLHALAAGGSNKEIARSLGLRPKTVAHHCAAIYAKLGARNRTEAVTLGLRRGLVRPHRD